MEVDISVKYAGLHLNSPIIVGSCSLTSNIKNLIEIEKQGAGAVVLKSIFEEEVVSEYNNIVANAQKMGIDEENLDYLDLRIKQDNINNYIELIKQAKATLKIPVIASINCITSSEWTFYTKRIEQVGADAIELNIFALPSDITKTAKEIEDIYFNIISEVKKSVKIPVIVKLSSYFTNLGKTIIDFSKCGIDALVLFNRYYNVDIDIKTKHIVASNVFSNPSDISLPLRWVAMASGRAGCSIASSTGVHNGEDLVKMLLAGANAVQIASTIYINGYNVISEMNEYLRNYLNEQDMESVIQIAGLASQRTIDNPAIFERFQFMRYFSDRSDIL